MNADRSLTRSAFGLPHVFLVPASMSCTAEPSLISTVLGSCVSLCLWDSMNGIGGMNHYVLPHAPPGELSLRYGDVAIDVLLQAMERHGATRRYIRAKLFGGAAVLPFGDDETIGEKNVRLALSWLSARGIAVSASHTGGERGLHVRFRTSDGSAEIREVSPRALASPP